MLRKLLDMADNFFCGIYNRFQLRRKKVKYEKDLRIIGRIHLYGSGQISLGSDAVIISCEHANPIGGDTHTIFSLAYGGALTIGDHVGMSNVTIVCHNEINIGNNVRIGGSTRIYDTDFHSLNSDERDVMVGGNVRTVPVNIHDGVFIGAHCIILKGVTVGEDSIVGAGSVVARDIPDHEIWAGNPARLIRRITSEGGEDLAEGNTAAKEGRQDNGAQ